MPKNDFAFNKTSITSNNESYSNYYDIDNSYSFLNNGLFEETYEERNNHLTNFDEVLFFRMVRWICLLKVRDQNEFGRWYWIVDLSGYEGKDIIK